LSSIDTPIFLGPLSVMAEYPRYVSLLSSESTGRWRVDGLGARGTAICGMQPNRRRRGGKTG
jgi:hypothetical protein